MLLVTPTDFNTQVAPVTITQNGNIFTFPNGDTVNWVSGLTT